MIINLLDKYSTEEQDKIIEMAERHYVYEYRRSGTAIDLYAVFNDAPYWGEGECANGKCAECKHNINKNSDGSCDEYTDEAYNDWFDGIIEDHEIELINGLHEQNKRQVALFQEDEEWKLLYTPITFRLMKWLNEKDITYCIIRGLIEGRDDIFVKSSYIDLDSEYRLLFSRPSVHDLRYAIDKLGWPSYSIRDLATIKSTKQKKIIVDWIKENNVGIVHQWNEDYDADTLVFENEIDAMAIKLRWAEYDEI